MRTESRRKAGTEETGVPGGEAREEGWAHLLLGAPLALPDVGGHDALHLLAQPGVLLELGAGGGERATYTGGTGREHPSPPESRGGGQTQNARARGEERGAGRDLGSQEADGAKPQPPLSSKWGLQMAIPGSPWLQAFSPVVRSPSDGKAGAGWKCGSQLAPCPILETDMGVGVRGWPLPGEP